MEPQLPSMQQALASISLMLREGELLCTQTLEQARGTFLDRNGRAANYATLCERVNALGVALADLKTQHAALQHDKHEVHGIIMRLTALESAAEREKIFAILQ